MSRYEIDSLARDKKIRFGRELSPIVFEREKSTMLAESDTSISVKDFEKIDTVVGVDGTASSSGGGIGDFAEETLDIVEDDNTAGQRIFLTKEVP